MPLTKAKRRSKVDPAVQPVYIENAIRELRSARDRLRKVGCKNAADYVARALKSAEGALRHANGCGAIAYRKASIGHPTPARGSHCLNLATAVATILYDRAAKLGFPQAAADLEAAHG